jgi:hypothetical protein
MEGRHLSPTEEENVARFSTLGQAWNSFFTHNAFLNKHWKAKCEAMAAQIAEREARLEECLAGLRKKDHTIMSLEGAKEEEYRALYEQQEVALAESEKLRKKLQGKMKTYKDRLNDNTKEQQDIFKYFKAKYQQIIAQVEKEELNHQASLEKALYITNETRNEIQQSVQQVQALSQQDTETRKSGQSVSFLWISG